MGTFIFLNLAYVIHQYLYIHNIYNKANGMHFIHPSLFLLHVENFYMTAFREVLSFVRKSLLFTLHAIYYIVDTSQNVGFLAQDHSVGVLYKGGLLGNDDPLVSTPAAHSFNARIAALLSSALKTPPPATNTLAPA